PAIIAERLLPFLEAKGLSVKGDPRIRGVVMLLRERAQTLVEMADKAAYFFSRGVTIDPKAAAKHLTAQTKPLLESARRSLVALPTWTTEQIDAAMKATAESLGVGMGKVAQPVRVAVTGGTASPGIGETLEL